MHNMSAYSSATGHGSQQTAVDLDDLLHCLTCYPVAGRRSRVGCYDDAALEPEGEGCGTVGNLDGAVGVGVVVCHGAEPRLCLVRMSVCSRLLKQGFISYLSDRRQRELERRLWRAAVQLQLLLLRLALIHVDGPAVLRH